MARDSARGMPPIRKSLGQHFLNDKRILTRIVDALDPTPSETVLEIGAGRGSMTDILRERAGRTIAIEYDRQLAEMLRQRYAGDSRVRVVEADVLSLDLGDVAGGEYALVGNVPYYITTPILFHALRRPRATRSVYLLQREVAERMSAKPGDREFGALSVNVQINARVESLFRIAPGAFNPPPKVESTVVRITPWMDPELAYGEEQPFRELVQAVFGFRRKQMRRVLRELRPLSAEEADSVLQDVGIAVDTRPETVAPMQFVKLFRRLGPA